MIPWLIVSGCLVVVVCLGVWVALPMGYSILWVTIPLNVLFVLWLILSVRLVVRWVARQFASPFRGSE